MMTKPWDVWIIIGFTERAVRMIKALARHPAQAVALAASMNDEELRYYAASQLFLKESP